MRAIRLHAPGPAENLVHEVIADPVPAPGQVRIAVAAAGVHLLDTALRQGKGPYPLPELPTVPGREVAGTVESLGAGTDPSWLGRHVVAHLGMVPGGYAELTVTDASRLHDIPPGVDAAAAVAFVGTGRTMLGIAAYADLGPGSVAVVLAAAGGIGTLLVQHAQTAGATVIGLAGGPAKVARVAAGGADLAVDYTRPGWSDDVRRWAAAAGADGATVVFDGVGGAAAREAVGLLREGGQHLVYGWADGGTGDGEPLLLTADDLGGRGVVSQQVLGPAMLERGGGLRALETGALTEGAAGRLRPAVSRYPLAEAATAHRDLESRRTTGKVVLEP